MADVAVLGLGNMGAAVARALLADGRSVVVQNRTATRCGPLANEGAEVAPSPTNAIMSAPVIIASVVDYCALRQAMADQLDLKGRTVINLTWGTTGEARELAEFVSTRGRGYVEGGVLCRPEAIGQPEGDILYSGPSEAIADVRSLLDALGPIHYLGSDLTRANALALALGSIFYASVLSFLGAAAYAERLGISPDVVAPLVRIPLDLAGSTVDASVDQIKRQDFVGSEASNEVHAAALASVAQAFTAADTEHGLTDAMSSYFDTAARMGLSHLEVGALLGIMSKTATQLEGPDGRRVRRSTAVIGCWIPHFEST